MQLVSGNISQNAVGKENITWNAVSKALRPHENIYCKHPIKGKHRVDSTVIKRALQCLLSWSLLMCMIEMLFV